MSTTTTIGVIVGSLSHESINRQLAQALIAVAPTEVEMRLLRIDDLPVYNRDDDARPPEGVKRLKAEVADSDGILFVTPEYNRSIPSVLKNVLDHGSRPYGHSVWAGTPAGIVGASPGAPGTSMAQQHLRNILAYLDMPTLGQPEVFVQVTKGMFDADGRLVKADTEKFLRGWMDTFVRWVQDHARSYA